MRNGEFGKKKTDDGRRMTGDRVLNAECGLRQAQTRQRGNAEGNGVRHTAGIEDEKIDRRPTYGPEVRRISSQKQAGINRRPY